MIDHLREHQKAGHHVPQEVFDGLASAQSESE
jgi:hypothetical protein